MDESKHSNHTSHQALLEKRIEQTLAEYDLQAQRQQIQAAIVRLNISLLDYAAALSCLQQPHERLATKAPDYPSRELNANHYRLVRYRLNVGSQHRVLKEQIQAVLIEESGVDKKRIGKIDIRPSYTLVELPEGMPADIFQLLSEATVCERKLGIKRMKPNRRNARNKADSGLGVQ